MWKPRNNGYLQPAAYSRRSTSFIDRDFQLKFTKQIIIMFLLSLGLLIFPAIYFANENYDYFLRLADLTSPPLAEYIQKEQLGLNIFFIAATLSSLVFWLIAVKKMTANIAGPLKILRNHMRLTSRGDLSLLPVSLRDDDEFKDLINTYNYLYTLLKVQNEKELEDLKKLQPLNNHPIADAMIKDMINERMVRLHIHKSNDSSDPFLKPSATHDSRHAS